MDKENKTYDIMYLANIVLYVLSSHIKESNLTLDRVMNILINLRIYYLFKNHDIFTNKLEYINGEIVSKELYNGYKSGSYYPVDFDSNDCSLDIMKVIFILEYGKINYYDSLVFLCKGNLFNDSVESLIKRINYLEFDFYEDFSRNMFIGFILDNIIKSSYPMYCLNGYSELRSKYYSEGGRWSRGSNYSTGVLLKKLNDDFPLLEIPKDFSFIYRSFQ